MRANTIGTCFKCGKEAVVRDHHYKGYNTDETKPYCISCDQKAHNRAKKEGRCVLTSAQSKILSNRSRSRRSKRTIDMSNDTMMTNVHLHEMIIVNINNMRPQCATYFTANHGKHLKYIDVE